MFAFVSVGADRNSNTGGLGRGPSGLLQRLQRRVALEALGESGASLGAEATASQTASMGAEVGAEACQWRLTQKRTLGAHLSEVMALPLSASHSLVMPSAV